jgi:hypothetical protein
LSREYLEIGVHLEIGVQEPNSRVHRYGLVVLRRCLIVEVKLATVISDVVQTPEAESLARGEGATSEAESLARGEGAIGEDDPIGEAHAALEGVASGSSGEDGSLDHRRAAITHDAPTGSNQVVWCGSMRESSVA